MFQDGFQAVVDDAATRCQEHFGDGLLAIYITGSVHTMQAIAGESDLDCIGILAHAPTPDDHARMQAIGVELDRKHAIVNGVHFNLCSLDALRGDRLTRFMIHYNSRLYWGQDILSNPAQYGMEPHAPSLAMAKSRLGFAQGCLLDALAGKQPQCTGPLPKNPYLAARKFAQYFVVIEGAYYLMALGQFSTFDRETILRQLRENTQGYDALFETTLNVLRDPLSAGLTGEAYLHRAVPFVQWMFDEIARA